MNEISRLGEDIGSRVGMKCPPYTNSLSETVLSVKPLFRRFKRFESVFSPGVLRSEKTDL